MRYLNYTLWGNIRYGEKNDQKPLDPKKDTKYCLHDYEIESLYFNSLEKTLILQLYNKWGKEYIDIAYFKVTYFECSPKIFCTDPAYFGLEEVHWIDYNQVEFDKQSSPQDLISIDEVYSVPAERETYLHDLEWDQDCSGESHLYIRLNITNEKMYEGHKVANSYDGEAYHFIRLDAEKTMAHEYTDPSKSLIPKVDFSRLNWDTGEIS